MYSSEYSQRWLSRVSCRSIFVLYSMLCLASLLEPVESHKPRCGTELIADLEFVCGDRGFYIEKANRFRSHHRKREHLIVDQCCLKGCSLNYMETFCAKAKNATPAPSQQVMEQQFQTLFHRRLVKHLETAKGAKRQTHRGPNQRQQRNSSLRSTEPLTSSPPTVSRNPLSVITQL